MVASQRSQDSACKMQRLTPHSAHVSEENLRAEIFDIGTEHDSAVPYSIFHWFASLRPRSASPAGVRKHAKRQCLFFCNLGMPARVYSRDPTRKSGLHGTLYFEFYFS
jgi:hypothetical protein